MSHLTSEHYPSVAQLVSSARDLVRAHPESTTLREVGTSRAGRPLLLLSVGSARRAVLVVAGAHANEPNGAATLLHLARRAVHDQDLHTHTSWHFLLCADPDGAHLHRSPAPGSLRDYHRHFFRPAGPEQPEWSPSMLPPDRLPPETLALTRVIDELRPYLQVSLHGVELGGSWVQLTKDVPGLAEAFAKSAAEAHIPLETSTPDAAGWPASGPGVHVMPVPDAPAAFPSMPDDVRSSTWHHAHRHGGLTAVVEVPMWASDRVDDRAVHPAPAAAMHELARRLRRETLQVTEILREAEPRLSRVEGPLLRAARWTLELAPSLADDWDRAAPEQATAAEISSLEAFGRRLPLRAGAMLLQALEAGGDPAATRLDELVGAWCDGFAERFGARWIPLADQVEHQARTVLAAAQHAPGAR